MGSEGDARVRVGVLGPVTAWGPDGMPLDLKGPRHRAVLARLAVARGRVVPLDRLIGDLWDDPPAGAAGAIRTFVGALRKSVDPVRPPVLLVTHGPGYALRAGPDSLDALTFDEMCAEAAGASGVDSAGASVTGASTAGAGPVRASTGGASAARAGTGASAARASAAGASAARANAGASTARASTGRTAAPSSQASQKSLPSQPSQASRVLSLADEGLRLWRGPAYAEFADEPWAIAECSRLTEARLALIERQGQARLALGRAVDAVPDLIAHAEAHPWREDGWRLLALALYQSGRQAEALNALRRARSRLAEEFGLDPGPRLAALEQDMLRQAPGLDPWLGGDPRSGGDPRLGGDTLTVTAGAFERVAPAYARSRVTTAAALAGSLALIGGDGLRAASAQRLAAIEEAEKLGDPELTARVIGNFAVPAIWTRSDDPEAAARIVAAAERALAALSPGTPPAGALSAGTLSAGTLSGGTGTAYADDAGILGMAHDLVAHNTVGHNEAKHSGAGHQYGPHAAARARLLATIALESRGSTAARPREAAAEAEAIARRLGDPALLAYALNGVWMQANWRAGLAPERDRIGEEIIALASRHGLADFAVLGRLIRLQALSALGDAETADGYAAELDRLSERHERPGVTVFTGWYRAMRAGTAAAYLDAARLLDGCGMPGVADGLLPLALLCHQVQGIPARTLARGGPGISVAPADSVFPADGVFPTDSDCSADSAFPADSVFSAGSAFPADTSWGPFEPWARPWLLLAGDYGGSPEAGSPGSGSADSGSADSGGTDSGSRGSGSRGSGSADSGSPDSARPEPGRPRSARIRDARDALNACPDPPPGLLAEALWCLTARAATVLGDEVALSRSRDALAPAASEFAAGSGMLTAGPVRDYL